MDVDRLHEERRTSRSTRLAGGTLACPECDAPVVPDRQMLSPVDVLGCSYCLHQAPVREFLSLGVPTRPTFVTVRVVGAEQVRARARSRLRV